jgi:hypothetical protein
MQPWRSALTKPLNVKVLISRDTKAVHAARVAPALRRRVIMTAHMNRFRTRLVALAVAVAPFATVTTAIA